MECMSVVTVFKHEIAFGIEIMKNQTVSKDYTKRWQGKGEMLIQSLFD
jgi:hypothetical protein